MIFVTIGSMFPFERMIRAMDAWAATEGRGEEILAQIGAGDYEPRHMTWVRKLDRPAYADAIRRSRLVVAHAGVGSIVTAGELCRPIVVLPRRAHLGEHTSDHQVEAILYNIFGGITRGDVVARGILEALDRMTIELPIVVRLDGTNAEEGRAMLDEAAPPNLYDEETMLSAAGRVVELARAR